MKKLLLTLAIGLISYSSYSYIIIKRTTSGGLFGLYSYTNRELQEYTDPTTSKTHLGWVVECSGYGLTSCPNKKSLATPLDPKPNEPDAVDIATSNNLFEISDAALENGQQNGESTVTVQVNGESFQRHYKIVWVTTETGGTITTISREDINY